VIAIVWQRKPERDGALDRFLDAVAGLADAGDLLGVLVSDLDRPALVVALDDLGSACVVSIVIRATS